MEEWEYNHWLGYLLLESEEHEQAMNKARILTSLRLSDFLNSLFFSDRVIGFQYITLGLPASSFHSSTSSC